MLENFVEIDFRDLIVVVTIVKVKCKLVQYDFVQKYLLDHSLIRFKVNTICEVQNIVPLFCYNVTIPLSQELLESALAKFGGFVILLFGFVYHVNEVVASYRVPNFCYDLPIA